MINFLKQFYGVLALIALILGFIVAVIFAGALIAGPDLGTEWAMAGGEIMSWGIAIAAVAVLTGLIIIYVNGSHTLKMEKKPASEDSDSA